jgi:hypothetical protein
MGQGGTARSRPIPRRGLSRVEAAMYLGISPSRFDEKRKAGEVPPPRRDGERKLWDIYELDMVFDGLPREDSPTVDPTWEDA